MVAPKIEDYKIVEHINKYKYIYLISIIGFVITAILKYPYPIHWDSNYAFTRHSIDHLPPTNWMGWFYPYFWDIFYKMTNTINSLGVFIQIWWWVSFPIIYINLFKNEKNTMSGYFIYNFCYLLFILCPYYILSTYNEMSNNYLVASFLLLSIALYALYNTHKNKLYIVSILILLVMISLVRRDAFIFVTPLVIFFSIILANYNKIRSGLILGVLLLTYMGANYLAIKDNSNYNSGINNMGIITVNDLAIMSYLKNELLFPDSILKEEFRNENRIEVLQNINSLYSNYLTNKWFDGVTASSKISPFLLSGTVWHSGLSAKDVLPIYVKNIPLYIELKLKIFLKYLTVLWLTLFLSFVGVVLLFIKPCSSLFSQEKKAFCLTVVGSSWISIGVTVLAANTVQYRYIIPPSMLMWIISIYIFYTIVSNYNMKVVFDKIEDN